MTDIRRGLARHSVEGVFWTALSLGLLAVAGMVSLVVLARLLSPHEFGLYSATLIVINLSAIYSNLGVAPAIVQRPELEERHLRVGFTLSIILSLLIVGIVWFIAPLIASFMHLPRLTVVIRGASIVFLCQGFCMVAEASAQRVLRFRWLAGVDAFAFAIGFAITGPALAWYGFGVWALVGALVAQNAVRMVILLAGQHHPKRPLLERRTISELLYFGGGFTIARVFNYLASQVDRLVVGRWLGAQVLGQYSLSSQFMTSPAMLVGQVLDRVLFPTMALLQNEPARLARAYRSGIASCALLVLPGSVVLMIVAPELVQVMLGPGWEGVVAPLQILAFGMLFRTSYKLSDSLVRATGAVYARAWRQAVFASLVAVSSWIGQHWGVNGVAIGVVVSFTCNFFLMADLSLRLTRMRWADFIAVHLPALALAGATGAVAWIFANWLRDLHAAPLVLLLVTGTAAAVEGLLLCWLFPSLFLGESGQSMLRVVNNAAPAWLLRRRPG